MRSLLAAACAATSLSLITGCSADDPVTSVDAGSGDASLDAAGDRGPTTDGAPTGCADDMPTGASLDAARTALDNGATEVALSPAGCVRYARTLQGKLLATEKFTDEGVVVLSFDRTTTATHGKGDFDRDGFVEWSYELTRGATSAQDKAVVTTLSKSTQAPVSRKTYTWTNTTTIHVVIEQDDGSKLVKLREMDVPRDQAGPVDKLPITPFMVTTSGCTPADAALIETRLREAMDGDPADKTSGGLPCLFKMGKKAEMMRLISVYVRDIEIECVSDPAIGAVYDGVGWFDPFGTASVTIRVNPTNFGKRDPNDQRRLLFHEMLHELGEHDPEVLKSPRVDEIDPTQACANTCWPTAFTTQCSCATCLGTDVCDPRCAKFKPCNPDMGAQCTCPAKGTVYPSCSACLTGCPSGLACFGYSTCKSFSVACGKKATCP